MAGGAKKYLALVKAWVPARIQAQVLALLNDYVLREEIDQAIEQVGADHGDLSGLSDDDHTQYLLVAGSRSLTGNWDAGSHRITAQTFTSDVATGTAPLTVSSTTLVSHFNADQLDGNDAADIDYSFVTGNDGDTDVSAAELEELTDGSTTTLHDHDVTGMTNWPTVDYSYVSGNDAATDVTAAELEELTDGSTTTKHDHDVTGLTNWPTVDYSYVSGNDAATDVTAAQLEELSDGSETSLHTHYGAVPVTEYSSADTAASTPEVAACDASGGAFTLTLPTAASKEGYVYHIKKTDASANAVTVDGNGDETIDGAATRDVTAQWECLTIVSDGTNWLVL